MAVYDPATGTWSSFEQPMPTKREHLILVAHENLLWAIGGRTAENTDVVEVFDPVDGTWAEADPLPIAVSGHTGAVLDGEIHVTGGEDLVAIKVFPDHQVLGADGTWRLDEPAPAGRHGLGSGAINGSWYVVGGAPGPDLSVSARLDIYAPD